jgi:hypothetical protein
MLPRSLSEGLGLARMDEAVRQSAHFNGGLDMALDVEDVGAKKPGTKDDHFGSCRCLQFILV